MSILMINYSYLYFIVKPIPSRSTSKDFLGQVD